MAESAENLPNLSELYTDLWDTYLFTENTNDASVSTATFFLLHCDEWDRVVALPRHKFVTGATLLQLGRNDPVPSH
jgi:hypothetical protein